MKNEDKGIELLFIAFSLGLAVGVLAHISKTSDFYNRAAQTSCAQYNPNTGNFEWLETDD